MIIFIILYNIIMGLFSSMVENFFTSKEKAKMNVQKSMELKEDWISKSEEWENEVDKILNKIKSHKWDWISDKDCMRYAEIWWGVGDALKSFIKRANSYNISKDEFEWFQDIETKANFIVVYIYIKWKLLPICAVMEWIKEKEENRLNEVKKFDGNWLDDFEDEWAHLVWVALKYLQEMNSVWKDDLEDLETRTADTTWAKKIVIDRLKKEFQYIRNLSTQWTDLSTKATKIYWDKKLKKNPNWKPKTFKV